MIFRLLKPIVPALLATAAAAASGCSAGKTEEIVHQLPDTLRVATLYSPSSYFLYRDEPMGYDYTLINDFANDKHLELKLEVVPSVSAAMRMLEEGKVDVIAYEIPDIAEYKGKAVACGPRSESYQVLVQPREGTDIAIRDVTDLPGHDVYVEEDSKYLYRLRNLDSELGGGIRIHEIASDSIIADDIFKMVADGTIPLTVLDNETAQVNAPYYPGVDSSVDLSFHQASAWAVSPSRKWLGDSIDAWLSTDTARDSTAVLHKRYFELARTPQVAATLDFSDGVISPYDQWFREYAGQIGWDWRLLASQSFQESRFNPEAVSWAGAKGLMQIMPRTARAYDLPAARMTDPEQSIATSVKLLDDLDRMLAAKVPDNRERLKFVLASYNGGIGHVTDAMALAEKYGMNPAKWDNNVERAVLMISDPQYYNDPVVKYGYIRGRETVDYVRKITTYYDRFKREIPA